MTVSKFVQCCISIFDHKQRSEIQRVIEDIDSTRKSIHVHEKRIFLGSRCEELKIRQCLAQTHRVMMTRNSYL